MLYFASHVRRGSLFMSRYELTLVLSDKATTAKKKSVVNKIEKLAKILKGKIAKSDDWGKINLSFPIQKNQSGVFLYFELELDEKQAKNLNDKLRMEDDIIRLLLVKGNN